MAAIGDKCVVRHAGTDAAAAPTRATTAMDPANGSHPKLATAKYRSSSETAPTSAIDPTATPTSVSFEAAAEDERHEIAVDGAERHPRAQLHGALPDEVRHHAVDAERRHQQRRQPEERHDQRVETLELQSVEDDVVYRPHVFHHQCRIGLPDGAADDGDQLIGRQVRADDDVHRVHPQDGGRQINLGCCWPEQAVVAHVADDADDLEAGIVGGC